MEKKINATLQLHHNPIGRSLNWHKSALAAPLASPSELADKYALQHLLKQLK